MKVAVTIPVNRPIIYMCNSFLFKTAIPVTAGHSQLLKVKLKTYQVKIRILPCKILA